MDAAGRGQVADKGSAAKREVELLVVRGVSKQFVDRRRIVIHRWHIVDYDLLLAVEHKSRTQFESGDSSEAHADEM